MIGAVLALLIQAGVPHGGAKPKPVPDPFTASVMAYTNLTTPRCSGELTSVYAYYASDRDQECARSLTPSLHTLYDKAVKAVHDRDAHSFYECGLAPSPPSPISKRAAAIADAQRRWTSFARDIPAYFDDADAAFDVMVTARDAAAGQR